MATSDLTQNHTIGRELGVQDWLYDALLLANAEEAWLELAALGKKLGADSDELQVCILQAKCSHLEALLLLERAR